MVALRSPLIASFSPSGPGTEETCLGTGSTRPTGEEIIAGSNQRFRVVAVVPFEEEDESPFVGMLKVDAA